MSPELVLSAARRLRRTWPADWICLTGGEPTLQDLGPLAGLLRADGWKVQIETNGTIWTPVPADWITISPKPPGFDVHPRMIGKAREIKLVVTRALAFADVVRVRNAFPARAPLYLQPESNAGWSRAKAERFYHRAVREGLAGMRLGIQLHRIYGFR
jgi:organic radical activating enzyme